MTAIAQDPSLGVQLYLIAALSGEVKKECEAVNQFLKEFEMLKDGKKPDGVNAFDD